MSAAVLCLVFHLVHSHRVDSFDKLSPPVDAHGDPLPSGALARLGSLRWRHGSIIAFAAYTPDGNNLVSASQDGMVRLWDVASGKEIRSFGEPWNPVLGDASQFTGSGGPLAPIMEPTMKWTSFALSRDGKCLACGAQNGLVVLWDVQTGQQRPRGKFLLPGQAVAALTFCADGKTLITKGRDEMVRFWDLASGRETRTFNALPEGSQGIGGGGGWLSGPHLGFALDDKILFARTAGTEKGFGYSMLKFWDVSSGKELAPLKIGTYPEELLAASGDGKTLLLSQNDALRLWDIETRKERRTIGGSERGDPVSVAAFSPDGKLLATRRGFSRTIQMWEVASGKERWQHREPFGFGLYSYGTSNLTFSPDGNHLTSGTGGSVVRHWDVLKGRELEIPGHRGAIHSLALPTDGKTVITTGEDEAVFTWERTSGKELSRVVRKLPWYLGGITHAALAPDGQTMILSNRDSPRSHLYLWNPAKKPPKDYKVREDWKAHETNLFGLAFSPDGKTVASRGVDQTTRLWDAAAGKELRPLKDLAPAAMPKIPASFSGYFGNATPTLIFSPDGNRLAAMLPNPKSPPYATRETLMITSVRVWDATTGKLGPSFDTAKSGIACLAFAPDGRTLAGGGYDGTITLWEVASGKVRFQFKAVAAGAVVVLAFSPDGKILAGAGQDQTLHFYDRTSGKHLGARTGHRGLIVCLAYSVDGKVVVSGSMDSTALIWEVPSPESIHLPAQPWTAEQEESLWRVLAIGFDAGRPYRAIQDLSLAPPRTVALLKGRLKPVPAPDPKILQQLIGDQDSDQFAVRQKAASELGELGELAEPALKHALGGKWQLETKRRFQTLLDALMTEPSLNKEQLQMVRAVELLEQIGTPEARDIVARLATGAPGARLTREAQATLGRWPRSKW